MLYRKLTGISTAAVQVTSPTKGAELDLTKPNTIKWTSVK